MHLSLHLAMQESALGRPWSITRTTPSLRSNNIFESHLIYDVHPLLIHHVEMENDGQMSVLASRQHASALVAIGIDIGIE